MTINQMIKGLNKNKKFFKGMYKEAYEMCMDFLNHEDTRLFILGDVTAFYKHMEKLEDVTFSKLPHLPFPKCVIHGHGLWDEGEHPCTINICILIEELQNPLRWNLTSIGGTSNDMFTVPGTMIIVPSLTEEGYLNVSMSTIALNSDSLNQSGNTTEEISHHFQSLMDTLTGFIKLLQCKNISTRERTFNKKGKVGVQRTLDYHEIVIKIPGKGYRYKEKVLKEMPFHEIHQHESMYSKRGHFKTFTEDAPLFGKHVGTWWWSPIFGQSRDYRIEIPK